MRRWAALLVLVVLACGRANANYFKVTASDIIAKSPWVDVRAYGAVGDNTTDDAAAITLAIAALSSNGGILTGDPKQTYKVATPLTITGKNHLTIRNLQLNGTTMPSGSTVLTVTGSTTATTTTFTAAGTKGMTILTVVSSSGFSAGDMVRITSTERFNSIDNTAPGVWPDSANLYLKGELGFVAAVDNATSITLASGLKDAYSIASDNVTITKVSQIESPLIDRVVITGGGAGKDHRGINVAYAKNPVVRNARVTGCETTGVDIASSDGGGIFSGYVSGANVSGGPGYSYSLSNLAQNVTVDGNESTDHWVAFTTGSYYPVWNYSVVNNKFHHTTATGFGINTHLNGVNGTFSGNTIDDSYIGMSMNGPGNSVIGNTVHNATYAGIYLANDGTPRTIVKGNTCTGLNGILGGTYTGDDAGVLSITGNLLEGWTVPGRSSDNVLYGVVVSSNSANVSGNTIKNFPKSLRVSGADNAVLDGNRLWGYTTAIEYAGTRTATVGNIFNGVPQSGRVLTRTGAGVAVSGNVSNLYALQTDNNITIEINGQMYDKPAFDYYWDLSTLSTGAGEYMKVVVGFDSNNGVVIIAGDVAATQALAKIPTQIPWNVAPVAIIEIPESYSGGDLTGYVVHDL